MVVCRIAGDFESRLFSSHSQLRSHAVLLVQQDQMGNPRILISPANFVGNFGILCVCFDLCDLSRYDGISGESLVCFVGLRHLV